MSTTQILYRVENGQPEPQRSLVERIPVREREKLQNKTIQGYSWEDFRGLSLGFEEDWS